MIVEVIFKGGGQEVVMFLLPITNTLLSYIPFE